MAYDHKAYCRKYYQENKLTFRDKQLQAKFGITLAQYEEMLDAQGNVCAICLTDTPGGRGAFHVDHCHDTGEIRGLLCHSCNTAIGHFKHDPSLLIAAAQYLG